MSEKQTTLDGASAQRPIPPIPGGGSWRFDETSWIWVSNNPDPEPVEQSEDALAAGADEVSAHLVGDEDTQSYGHQE